jgi:2-(1,2-epoxy-1,2-dihydrophenyl)acetyl-CoA isomerase
MNTMDYEDLLLDRQDGVATITLNAPEKMNALTNGMRRSLLRVADEIARDDDVRVAIVTGAGRGFCAGADLSSPRAEQTRRQRLEFLGASFGAEAFFSMDKPVIAAVNGACVGAGFSLALSMDIRIASEAARFGAVFVRRGLVPDCGLSYWLPHTVGAAQAMEMMFTGDIIDARRAAELGIVSKVVAPEDLMTTAQELASKIAAQPPISVELSKRMAYRGIRDDLARQIEVETGFQRICSGSEDNVAAVRAFLEKRPPPRFTGT